METKIIIERHGQSLGNAEGRYLGHTNLDLSEMGRKQAEMSADYMKDEKIDAIYSSDLLRAHNTALPHALRRGLDVIDSTELREMYLGDWEGAKVEFLKRECYQEFVIEWLGNFGTFKFPGGESVLHAADRMYNEVLRIAQENAGKTVLVASHAAAIRAFWCKISNVAPSDMAKAFDFPTNASLSTVIFDGEKFIPKEYSFDKHISVYNHKYITHM